MLLPSLAELDTTAALVYQHMQPSPELHWPLLSERCGCEVWVKHENHNPTGAFKVRGGLVHLSRLRERQPGIAGVVTATRGNHGQSIALAAGLVGLKAVIVVPEGNSPDKNAAMRALGAELVVHGRDFDDAVTHARELAEERALYRLPSFHQDLVQGVASYSLELLRAQPALDRVYVPIGLGSGICGMICARQALGLRTRIIGVVSTGADCYARSLAAGKPVSTPSANTLADGMAVRNPDPEALDMMLGQLDHVVAVTDAQVMAAVGHLFTDTHNVAEGAGAAPLAALLQERDGCSGEKVGLVLTGGNIDRRLYTEALSCAGA